MSLEASARRVAAVVLPDLLVEVASGTRQNGLLEKLPFGVIATLDSESSVSSITARHRLEAVSPAAEKLGLRAGLRISEAQAALAQFEVKLVHLSELSRSLMSVAEVLSSLGSTVSLSPWLAELELGLADLERTRLGTSLPCVWVDVSGVGHLYGSEAELALEIRERVRLLGHSVRVVIANGPETTRAIASFGELGAGGLRVIPPAELAKAIQDLPLLALPLGVERIEFLSRLGMLSVAELVSLPRASAMSRLGPNAPQFFELMEGREDTPLVACAFPEFIEEKIEFEEGATSLEPVLFALRGLTARASARLRGRGQAGGRLTLTLFLEKTKLEIVPDAELIFELSAPIWREGELFRVLRGRLEKAQLNASCLGLRLWIDRLEKPVVTQLSMSSGLTSCGLEASELPILLSELESDLGQGKVGLLSVRSSHKPEERTSLGPVFWLNSRRSVRSRSLQVPAKELDRATRIFAHAWPLGAPLARGQTLFWMQNLYTIEKLKFVERLDAVEWWAPVSASRDYFWAILSGPRGVLEALTYIDRRTGEGFLQGFCD
jgi:protein ImuB